MTFNINDNLWTRCEEAGHGDIVDGVCQNCGTIVKDREDTPATYTLETFGLEGVDHNRWQYIELGNDLEWGRAWLAHEGAKETVSIWDDNLGEVVDTYWEEWEIKRNGKPFLRGRFADLRTWQK